MRDACTMRFVEGVGDLNRVLKRLVERQRAFGKPVGQRLTFQVLHDEKQRAVVLAHVMQRADVRMVQGRNGPRLMLKPRAELRVTRQVIREDLDGDRAVEARIPGSINFPHSAGTDGGLNFVGPETGAWTKRHRCRESDGL
jgi:hypothetical protein